MIIVSLFNGSVEAVFSRGIWTTGDAKLTVTINKISNFLLEEKVATHEPDKELWVAREIANRFSGEVIVDGRDKHVVDSSDEMIVY